MSARDWIQNSCAHADAANTNGTTKQMVRIRASMAALLVALCVTEQAGAHEIQASVADLTIENGRVSLAVATNLEARLAGIGTEHEDTDESPQRATYDALRALSPDALEERLATSNLADGIVVTAGDRRVPLGIAEAAIPPGGDLVLARETKLVLTGDLLPGASSITVAAPGFGDFILRGTGANAEYSEFLQGQASQSIAVAGATERTFADVFVQYLGVGFEHIVPLGLDHILFVIGLFLLAPRLGPLLWQVSAFTLAHTVTLALGALDIIVVEGWIVESLIGASIVYVCIENVLAREMTPWRPVLIFAFGLLHGLGFASVFEEYGIPDGQFVAALLAFNIGVEAGQIAVLAVCFAVLALPFARRSWYRGAVVIPLSLAIGAIGLYWVLTRTGLSPEFLPGL